MTEHIRTEPSPPALRPVAAPTALPSRTGPGRRHEPTVDPAWLRRMAARTGIPQRAMRAYAQATLSTERSRPGCHLGWTTLAGIGWVESQHGTIGGRVLRGDGRPSAPISGPTLDGRGPIAAVRLEGGWARARGPMQFLASTWAQWGADGDADGTADVDDLDDAALAAASYLCAAGGDLATTAGWDRAVLAYNHSTAYAWAVRREAVEAAALAVAVG